MKILYNLGSIFVFSVQVVFTGNLMVGLWFVPHVRTTELFFLLFFLSGLMFFTHLSILIVGKKKKYISNITIVVLCVVDLLFVGLPTIIASFMLLCGGVIEYLCKVFSISAFSVSYRLASELCVVRLLLSFVQLKQGIT